jgi:hypothetical protein
MIPLKEDTYFTMYLSTPRTSPGDENDTEAYYTYIRQIQKEVKMICPTCKHIFDKMFELRLQRLSELTDEINITFNLPPKRNPKERRNGKEKQ